MANPESTPAATAAETAGNDDQVDEPGSPTPSRRPGSLLNDPTVNYDRLANLHRSSE